MSRFLAFLVLLGPTCGVMPPKEVCSRLYRRCVDDSSGLVEYLDCREKVNAQCLRDY